jgi:hypothetical protein
MLYAFSVGVGMGLALVVNDSPAWALFGWLYLFSFPFRGVFG